MHQALQIAEILELILRYTSPSTAAACARVCRAWSEPALDGVWYNLHRLDVLFKLLGPTEYSENDRYAVTVAFTQQHILPERWDRFLFYSKRTRHLEYSRHIRHYEMAHPHALATVAISRPFLHLFPNLTHLIWWHYEISPSTALMLSILFMSPTLKSIVIQSEWEESMIPNHEIFHHIVARSPHIQHFGLITKSQVPPELGAVVAKSISALPNLKSVLFSDTFLTTNVLKALSTLPHLEEISQELEESVFYLPQISLPPLENGSFPNLKEIHIRISLTNATKFLSPFSALHLRQLFIKAGNDESHATISGFFGTVGTRCLNLQNLELKVLNILGDVSEPLPFTTLEPLLACKSLASLSINTPLLLDLDNAQIASMASNWPCLRKLHLTPQPWPHPSHNIHLTLSVLPLLARLRPEIEHIGIHIHPEVPTEPCSPLLNLQKLVLGTYTNQYNPDDIAFFLIEATSPTCKFAVEYLTGQSVPYPWVIQTGLYDVARHLETAVSRVPMMRKVDGLYRERIDALEEEIHRLTVSLN